MQKSNKEICILFYPYEIQKRERNVYFSNLDILKNAISVRAEMKKNCAAIFFLHATLDTKII